MELIEILFYPLKMLHVYYCVGKKKKMTMQFQVVKCLRVYDERLPTVADGRARIGTGYLVDSGYLKTEIPKYFLCD